EHLAFQVRAIFGSALAAAAAALLHRIASPSETGITVERRREQFFLTITQVPPAWFGTTQSKLYAEPLSVTALEPSVRARRARHAPAPFRPAAVRRERLPDHRG